MRPRILDLFCGAGGAALGYHRAGFDVVGVDIAPQPRYPFKFVQADAMAFLQRMVDGGTWQWYGPGLFQAVHASPPCQANSSLRHLWPDGGHPNLLTPTRTLLKWLDKPWVIENVPGAPMRKDVVLCGSMFHLGANCHDGVRRQLRRHRWFEFSRPRVALTPQCQHRGQPVGVYGYGGGGAMTRGYKGTKAEYREAMGMPDHSKAEIAQAIPPAYTEWIGRELMEML